VGEGGSEQTPRLAKRRRCGGEGQALDRYSCFISNHSISTEVFQTTNDPNLVSEAVMSMYTLICTIYIYEYIHNNRAASSEANLAETQHVCCNTLPRYTATTHCNVLLHTAAHCCNALQRTATRCNALQRAATHCNALQRTATELNRLNSDFAAAGNRIENDSGDDDYLTCTATHCNTPQRTDTHCNTLQHTATHCNTLQHTAQCNRAKSSEC